MAESERLAGGCLCGGVRFEVQVPERTFSVCHCGMCRKWSAGPFMAVHCPGDVRFTEEEGLAWYAGSAWAERGFCSRCGASLFWRLAQDPGREIIVSVEAFDDPAAWSLDRHIYVDAQPGRYGFDDARPRVTEAELMEELGITPPS